MAGKTVRSSSTKLLKAPFQKKSSLSAIKRQLVKRLDRVAKGKPNFWDFRDHAEDLASKKLFQYPAMMVPALQKQVIATMLYGRQDIQTILDPFLGSGTILALAMLNGRSFIGMDINPLSILIAKTRAYSLNYPALGRAVLEVAQHAKESTSNSYSVRFVGQSKWFTQEASIGLSRLRDAIRKQPCQTVRRFLWVCLAETVRRNSNSRTSTFKLHIKPECQRNATTRSVLSAFDSIAQTNVNIVTEFVTTLSGANLLDDDFKYKRPIKLEYGDSALNLPQIQWTDEGKCDLVVTSPPYGDNRTTVPYGQAAWLPLKWIDICDIDNAIPTRCAEHAYDVDNRSLGGTRDRKLFKMRKAELAEVGPVTKAYLDLLSAKRGDGASRFVHFAFDLKKVIENVSTICREGAKVVLTLGHRNISQTVCPLTDVCSEEFARHGINEVVRIDRQIQSKRMPGKNAHSATINHEYISILHKIIK